MHSIEKGIYFTILGATFVLITLFIFFVFVIRRYQKRKVALYVEKIRSQTNWLEKEKARIAADLHDDLGASLSAIKFRLHCMYLPNEEYNLTVTAAEKYIDEAMQKLRDISYNMTPRILKDKGLKEALNDLIDTSGIYNKIHTKFDGTIDMIDDDTGLHIYRIVQEILSNITRHANATSISLNIVRIKNELELHVNDNGTGFDRSEILKNKGQGLQNIRSRVDILHAKMFVNSAPEQGVDYLIKIPLSHEQYAHNKSNHR